MLSRIARALLALALLLPCAAPAPAVAPAPLNQPAPGSSIWPDDGRVAEAAFRLGVAGLRFCPERLPLSGLLLQHLGQYAVADQPDAIGRFALDKGPGIVSVVAASPAARSGLAAGDVLLRVNGRAFPTPLGRSDDPRRILWRAQAEQSESLLEDQLRLGTARLDILRDGRPLTLSLDPVWGCPARGRLARSSQKNAFGDGRYVIVASGLLPSLHGDGELAIVVAHELSHNILHHWQQRQARGLDRGLDQHFGAGAGFIKQTEEDADRLSVKLLWAAGYDLDSIIPFWRRFEDQFGGPFQIVTNHPGIARRERLLREAIDEVRRQKP
jgi:hypothetical protein